MVVVVDNQKSAHHSRHLGMPLGKALGHSMLVEVVAKRVVQSLWFLPSLVVPSLMHVFIVISSPCNIIVTRLIAKL
ncbi:hypothetical protein AHAS_Ahas07G0161700 [Arachis hypogaea]